MMSLVRTFSAVCLIGVFAIFGASLSGCSKENASSTTITTGTGSGGKPTTLEYGVGETAVAGDVKIMVPVLTLTAVPARPLYPLSSGAARVLAEGETYYQAIVRIENAGDATVRVDPADFSAMVGRSAAPMDRLRSGPSARTLLHGTSLEVILTYVVPEGSSPELVYHPPWLNGTMIFTGEQKPLGAN